MIIFISGSMNSGKSTVAKLLADKLGNTALVEIDSLREFIDWMPIENAVPINLENAVQVIATFARNNLDVVVPYPLSAKNCEYILRKLSDYKSLIKIYTLNPALETALSERGERKLSDFERERIKHHYAIGIPELEVAQVLDTNDKTPGQVVEMILSDLRS